MMNKTVGGTQCTILWHVDNMKVSHASAGTVADVLKLFNDNYGKITPLVTTRGWVHSYLGIAINFTEPGQVKFMHG